MVQEKFDTDVAASIGKLKDMMDGVQQKSDQLKSFGDELVKTIEAAFEEVFVCLKQSYTTLLQQVDVKLQKLSSQLESDKDELTKLASWSSRLEKAYSRIKSQCERSLDKTDKRDETVNMGYKESILVNSNLLS